MLKSWLKADSLKVNTYWQIFDRGLRPLLATRRFHLPEGSYKDSLFLSEDLGRTWSFSLEALATQIFEVRWFRPLHPGRYIDHEEVRWHRPGAVDRPASGRDDGW